MEPVRDLDAYRRCVGTVRRATPDYTSNLYASAEQLERWCATGRLRALVSDRSVLLLRADRDFHHVFHVAEDQAALGESLLNLPAGRYAADLIGQGDALDRICGTYAAAGFAPHAFLCRMARTQPSGDHGDGGAIVASEEDVPEVAALLERLLDRFVEQIPDADDLKREARRGQLLIVRSGTAILGMLMYDLKGQSAQLRFWHVDERARGQGVGRTLMAGFLARCAQARRLILWVLGDNARSIAIYRHYGFATDGLLDRIMTLHKEPIQ